VTTNDYAPIDCAVHSELELLALRRADVLIDCCAEGHDSERIAGVVVDLETRGGAEYLVVRTADGTRRLRLDHLLSICADGRDIPLRQ
jgi:transcriptional antiterminator Rof (Rho-off)